MENQFLKKYNKEQVLFHISLCDKVGKYDELYNSFEYMVKTFNQVSKSDRSYLDRAIKFLIQAKQKRLHKLTMLIEKENQQGVGFSKTFVTI
jgi:hypothetical protein